MDYKVAKLNQENLVKQYTPLVKYIASRVILEKNKNLEYEDIVGYGYIGLMEAIKTYDPSKGAKFSTYATLKIKGAIIDELRNSKIISRRSASKVAEYYKAIEALQKNLLREPTDKEIKEFMNIGDEEIRTIRNNINLLSMVSLEGMLSKDDVYENTDIIQIKDKEAKLQDEILEEKELESILFNGIERLNKKEQMILNLYYNEELTLKEIGYVLKISESRVCQLHSIAILNLRNYLKQVQYAK